MASPTLRVTKSDGTVCTITLAGTLVAGQVNQHKKSLIINGTSVEATIDLPGHTPAPGSE